MNKRLIIFLFTLLLVVSACSKKNDHPEQTAQTPTTNEKDKDTNSPKTEEKKPEETVSVKKPKSFDELEKDAQGIYKTDTYHYIMSLNKQAQLGKLEVKDVPDMYFPIPIKEYEKKYGSFTIPYEYAKDKDGKPFVDSTIEGVVKKFETMYKENTVNVKAVLKGDATNELLSVDQGEVKLYRSYSKDKPLDYYKISLDEFIFGEMTQAQIKAKIEEFGKPVRLFVGQNVRKDQGFIDQTFNLVYKVEDDYFVLSVISSYVLKDDKPSNVLLSNGIQYSKKFFEELQLEKYKEYSYVELK